MERKNRQLKTAALKKRLFIYLFIGFIYWMAQAPFTMISVIVTSTKHCTCTVHHCATSEILMISSSSLRKKNTKCYFFMQRANMHLRLQTEFTHIDEIAVYHLGIHSSATVLPNFNTLNVPYRSFFREVGNKILTIEVRENKVSLKKKKGKRRRLRETSMVMTLQLELHPIDN